MKIAIKVIVCSPDCNFIRQDFTDQGLTGVGDATLNGRERPSSLICRITK